VNDQTRLSATQSLVFSSPSSGLFSTSSIAGTQIGRFIWEGVSDLNRFVNISTRGEVGTGSKFLIGGFVVSGSTPKRILIRGIGPTLAAYGIFGVLLNPVLTVFNSQNEEVAVNDDWVSSEIADAFSQVGAFELSPNSFDSAVILTLPSGSYTAQLRGKNQTTGVALLEIYELP